MMTTEYKPPYIEMTKEAISEVQLVLDMQVL